jgi:hypothetical protein
MRQIVGCCCVLCGKGIASIADGGFCRSCGCPVHADCVGSRPEEAPPPVCAACGAGAEAVARERERAQRQPPPGRPPAELASRFGETLALLFFLGLTTAGVGSLGLYAFASSWGTTPEGELTLAEGVGKNVRQTTISSRYGETYVLHFTVGPYATEYASDRPEYEGVRAAVESGEPIRVWVSTKRETLFERQGWVPLYKVEHGGSLVLRYASVVDEHRKGEQAILIVGSALTVVGVVAFAWHFRKRWVDARNREMYRRAMEARAKLREG